MLVASLLENESSVDHGQGGFQGGFKSLICVSKDSSVTVLEALPLAEEHHGFPEKAKGVALGVAHKGGGAEVRVVKGGCDLGKDVVGGREVASGNRGGGLGRRVTGGASRKRRRRTSKTAPNHQIHYLRGY
ncbi:hypothetical protein RJT34_16452 [Clitoria ternatea]|uniref:Uncharacterized protein n=1 Tax=Clitoria ternatea TaxID=43366 RepID=A0AAN9PDN7_CLITE